MHINIIVHERIPVEEFRTLLYQFFQVMRKEDGVKGEKVEIQVVKRREEGRGGAEEEEEDVVDDE